MMLNLAFTSLRRSSQDRFSLHSTVNLHITKLDRLDENILKYNKQHDVRIMSFNTIDDDAEATLNFVDSIIDTSDNSTILTDLFEASDHMFVD
jgi:molybdopterin/thiamine biosynthesis adenylyltransferase